MENVIERVNKSKYTIMNWLKISLILKEKACIW